MQRATTIPTVLSVALLVAACGRTSTVEAPVAGASESASVTIASSHPEPLESVPPDAELQLSRADALDALCRVLDKYDADCDRRITIEDRTLPSCPEAAVCDRERSSGGPELVRLGRYSLPLARTHQAAQLVSELVLGLESEQSDVQLDLSRVNDNPVTFLERRIRVHYWDALTRRIDPDPELLLQAAADEKREGTNAVTDDWCNGRLPRCERAPKKAEWPVAPTTPRALHAFVPSTDPLALRVFTQASAPAGLTVHVLPEHVTPEWVGELTRLDQHGLLTLALDERGRGLPFVVPGGRFNEMYGWDSFFITWGLVQDPLRLELARAMVDHHVYEIRHYGKILNANRSYYLTRSQPPFLTSMIDEVWSRLPPTAANRAWLDRSLASAMHEYQSVWNRPPRRTRVCDAGVCLARYFGEGRGQPPEVEEGHFAWFYQSHARAHGHCQAPGAAPQTQVTFVACAEELGRAYQTGALNDPEIDAFFQHDRCVRESGHDTTFRWFSGSQEHCSDFASVDLNALLFKYELDIARLIDAVFDGNHDFDIEANGSPTTQTTLAWCERARARARLITRHHWDEASGLFFDHDLRAGKESRYLSATALYPLWASAPNPCDVALVNQEQASRLAGAALAALEAPGGLMATAPSSLRAVSAPLVLTTQAGRVVEQSSGARQWEAPNGWAPHQMLAWQGLRRWGLTELANRLTYRWLFTIVKNAADYHGTVPEKFDVVARSHRVFAEYGNVNTDFAYIAREGFGWMNASFLVGLAALPDELRRSLERRAAPEDVFR